MERPVIDLMPRFWLAFTALTTASLVGFSASGCC
jgi:hypothetical protein